MLLEYYNLVVHFGKGQGKELSGQEFLLFCGKTVGSLQVISHALNYQTRRHSSYAISELVSIDCATH